MKTLNLVMMTVIFLMLSQANAEDAINESEAQREPAAKIAAEEFRSLETQMEQDQTALQNSLQDGVKQILRQAQVLDK